MTSNNFATSNNYINYIDEYNNGIEEGIYTVGEKVRFIYSYLAKMSKITECDEKHPFRFDIEKATRPITFIERFMRISVGKKKFRQRVQLEVFQKAYLQAVYGFVDQEGLRQYRETLLVEGRKNGKTFLGSGIDLYMLVGDMEGDPEVDICANTYPQACIPFNDVVKSWQMSPELQSIIKKRKTDLYCNYNFGSIKPLSSEGKGLYGKRPSMLYIDEAHVVDREVYDIMEGGTSMRDQPLTVITTTAGYQGEGMYEELYERATNTINALKQKIEGKSDDSDMYLDERFLPVVYELESEDDWANDHQCWYKANPNMNVTFDESELAREVKKAQANPALLPNLLTQRFNLPSTKSNAWLTWDELHNSATFTMEDIKDTYACFGVDLSESTDLTCATALIRKPNDETFYVLQKYWIPERRVEYLEKLNRSKEAPYRLWAEQEYIDICSGSMVDYDLVTEWFVNLYKEWEIAPYKIGFDVHLATNWRKQMGETFGEVVLEPVNQTWIGFTEPMQILHPLLADKKINYNQNPILEWNLANTEVENKGRSSIALAPKKMKSNQRIDGTVSLINAMAMYVRHKDEYLYLVG